MAHIRVAAAAAQGPCAPAYRVRTQVPAAELARHGIDIVPFPLFSPDLDERFHQGSPLVRARTLLAARRGLRRRLEAKIEDCAVTLVQRQVDMLPGRRLERLACSTRRVVLDIDDAVWLDHGFAAGGHPLAFLKRSASKIRWLAERADHILAGNEYLADWLREANPQVTVLPSLVAADRVPARRHVPSEHVTLGWIGSATTVRYLTGLRPALERLAVAAPRISWELCVLGGSAPNVRGMACRSLRWSEAAEGELLKRMDIGLMPLADDAWTRGKCAYKALVYMSAGIPVVADAVGVTATVIGDQRAGLLSTSQDEWIAALVGLASDTSLRARMGAEGRRRVQADFSTAVWAPRLAKILRGES